MGKMSQDKIFQDKMSHKQNVPEQDATQTQCYDKMKPREGINKKCFREKAFLFYSTI